MQAIQTANHEIPQHHETQMSPTKVLLCTDCSKLVLFRCAVNQCGTLSYIGLWRARYMELHGDPLVINPCIYKS